MIKKVGKIFLGQMTNLAEFSGTWTYCSVRLEDYGQSSAGNFYNSAIKELALNGGRAGPVWVPAIPKQQVKR